MKIAVMQPYLLPYIGYWELFAATDVFVLLDDVQFVRRGWINRNRIRSDGAGTAWSYLTVPVRHAPRETKISDMKMQFNPDWDRAVSRRLETLYGKRVSGCSLSKKLVSLPTRSNQALLPALLDLLRETCGILQIWNHIVSASEIDPFRSVPAQKRIIDLVVKLGGNEYVNLPGGKGLYDASAFAEAGIKLRILPETSYVSQIPVGPYLSILDGILAGELDRLQDHLHRFEV